MTIYFSKPPSLMEAIGVRLKLMLVGDLHVGKSAIVERYMTGTLTGADYSRSSLYKRELD